MAHDSFEKALIQALKPLIRIAIRRGVEFGPFAEAAKRAFVEVVEDDFRVPGRKSSISRIAVLTGLTRRESSRLVRSRDDGAESPNKRFSRAARIFEAWRTDVRFLDKRRHPASLPFESDEGNISFGDLVRAHGADVPPRAVLDEMLRVGAVHLLKDGRIRPSDRAYVPQLDDHEKLAILGSDVADLIGAIDHNLSNGDPEPFFQRKVSYDNLPADYLPELRGLVRKDAQHLLEKLSANMSQHDRDVIVGSGDDARVDRRRAMVGIYYFEEEYDEQD